MRLDFSSSDILNILRYLKSNLDIEIFEKIEYVVIQSGVGLDLANAGGNVKGLAELLFSTYVWPFEIVSALLITAALGAMVLAHHQRIQLRPTQRQLSTQRFRGESLANAAGLPGPGVFARHNAVDVPALLPDGTPALNSINATLEARGNMLNSGNFQLGNVDTSAGEEK